MSLFSNLVSAAAGAGIASMAKDYIEKQGGIQAVISQLESTGLGTQVKSWVGTGSNLPISAEQVSKMLDGMPQLKAMAEKLGISPDSLNKELAEHLPAVVDQMTPNGEVPAVAV